MPEQVATAIVSVDDARAGTIELCSAGHPPPLLFTGADAEELLVPTRPLLGVGAGEGHTVTVDLPPGATLGLYTGGLGERRDDDVTSALERLRRIGFQAVDAPLAAWADRLLELLPGAGDDDTTVLALRLPGTTDD